MNKPPELYDQRNEQKKKISSCDNTVTFKEGDLWRCALGMNIGSESFGKGEYFRRPILVLKKLSSDLFVGVLLGTSLKEGSRFYIYTFGGQKACALLHQIKTLHKHRLQRKMGELPEKNFKK